MWRPAPIIAAGRRPLTGRPRTLVTLAALAAACAACGPSPAPRGPLSALVITVDTLRPDHLGCYGDGKAATPGIDALAAEGVLFERAYAPVPLTLPSHCTLFTGTYPARHGVHGNGYRLSDAGNRTLAEILRDKGYRTAAFVGAMVLQRKFGLSQGFETYGDAMPQGRKQAGLGFPERRAGAVVAQAMRWLRRLGGGRGGRGGRPFFLWVHLFDPHREYNPPAPYRQEYAERPYDGEIAYVDREIRRLLGALDDLGPRPRTLITLLSDHGEGLGEHRESTHGVFLYDATLRVPLILAGAGRLPRGLRVTQAVSSADLAPTLLGLLGIPPPPEMQGRDLGPLLSRGALEPEPLYAESRFGNEYYGWSPLRSLRQGRWKLIDAPRPEIYDVEEDPDETRNFAPERSELVGEMRATLRALEERLAAGAAAPQGGGSVDRETRRMLARLGYVGDAVRRDAVRRGEAPAPGGGLADPKDRVDFLAGVLEASTLVNHERYREGEALLERLIREEPGCRFLYTMRAEALVQLGELPRARETYRALLEIDPRNAEAYTNLGTIAMARGEAAPAERSWGRALDIDPDIPEARLGLGSLLARDPSRAGAAREHLEAFLRLAPPGDPDVPRVRDLLARLPR